MMMLAGVPDGKPLRARDIMRRDIVTIAANAGIWDLARLLSENGISGVPVVDDKGVAIGVVSQTDIVNRLKSTSDSPSGIRPFYEDSIDDESLHKLARVKVSELMTPQVIQASEDATVAELSQLMLRRGVHRIIITRDGKPCGIVTTLYLLHYM